MNLDIDLHTARYGVVCSGILCIILSLITGETNSTWFFILSVVSFCAVFFFAWFIRCPSCGHRLGRYYGHMEYCPHCGEHL